MKQYGQGFPLNEILAGKGVANTLMPPNHPRHYVYELLIPRRRKLYLSGIDCLCDALGEIDEHFRSGNFPRLQRDHPRTRRWMAFVRSYYGEEEGAEEGALREIRKFYDVAAEDVSKLVEGLPLVWGRGGVGTWWRTMDRKPSPEMCPGDFKHSHPVNSEWCQLCGWIRRWVEIDGLKYNIETILYPEPDEGHFFTLVETDIEVGRKVSFVLASSATMAGGDTQMRWRWLANNDPAKVIEALGQKAMARWALHKPQEPDIPGAPTDLRSFAGFLAWLGDHAEAGLAIDHVARNVQGYHEGLEQDIGFAPKVAFRCS